jgi:hypothetical protein
MGVFDWFGTKNLSDVLSKTYKVKVQGVLFELRKIDPTDFMAGNKAMIQLFDTYKTAKEKDLLEAQILQKSKIRDHYADTFLAAVIEPKLVRSAEDQDKGIWVQNLFSDWEFANELYGKIKLLTSLKTGS